jgi:hypothetical protein
LTLVGGSAGVNGVGNSSPLTVSGEGVASRRAEAGAEGCMQGVCVTPEAGGGEGRGREFVEVVGEVRVPVLEDGPCARPTGSDS